MNKETGAGLIRDRTKLTDKIIASLVGGAIMSTIVCPLDVVKTRLQAQPEAPHSVAHINFKTCQPSPHFQARNSVVSFNLNSHLKEALFLLVKYEGIRSLWKGYGPTLISTIPNITLYYVLYETLLERWNVPSFAGMCARTISVFFTSPVEMVRTYAQSKKGSQGTLQVLQRLIQGRGMRGLWIGIGPTFWRDVPFSAVYWPIFETSRQFYKTSSHWLLGSFQSDFLAGATAGSIAAFLATPADVLKTRTQMAIDTDKVCKECKRVSMGELVTELYQKEGIRGFFRGVTPRVLRIAPASALMISSYDYCKQQLEASRRRKNFFLEER